jgi:transcription initiation factor TFIID subunit 2
MDFGTINQRLNQNKYATMEEFESDVRLVFSNCRQFNPPTTYPCNCADVVEQLFIKEWTKLADKKLDYGDKRSMLTIMNQLIREEM